jgi:protocatechuate 3,4-dioxygenase beta subunit
MRVNHREDELENHDRGLDYDLPKLLQRRGMLKLVAGASVVALTGCATAEVTSGGSSTGTSSDSASAADGTPRGARPGGPPPGEGGAPGDAGGSNREVSEGEIPEETAGPYPGDGSNGANVLTESGVVRSDITTSFGSSTTKAEGVPLKINMTIQNFDQDKAAYAGVAVYVWHCDRAGQYSMYSEAVANENYLRGVQEADAQGQVSFTSIFPACYDGRWPHIHFEVYPSLAKTINSANKIATSQMALTEESSKAVYATAGYEQSVQNLSRVNLQSDNVFSDGYDLQLPEITGSPTAGYTLNFTCAI